MFADAGQRIGFVIGLSCICEAVSSVMRLSSAVFCGANAHALVHEIHPELEFEGQTYADFQLLHPKGLEAP